MANPVPVSYNLSQPASQLAPIVVNSPHSGRFYSKEFVQQSRLNNQSIRRSEDFLVDELVKSAVDCGFPLLSANYPRAYLDVNREPFELDPAMFDHKLPDYVNTRSIRVSSGLGTVPKIVAEGENIYAERLPVSDALERVEQIYKPYHDKLRHILAQTHLKFGLAILLDFHSMPSTRTVTEKYGRADIVLGDRFGSSCSPKIVYQARAAFEQLGYRTEVNRPYAGGFITEHYGRPFNGLHALQIEINRSLYMDEIMIRESEGFNKLSSDIGEFFELFLELDWSDLQGNQPLAAE
ncbi:MAG: N-formylglutamate amidohydrolase [Pseudomonadota bacterium]